MKTIYEKSGHSFPHDVAAIYGHVSKDCYIKSWRKREENVTAICPRNGCPKTSVKGHLNREYGIECWSINRIRRCQEQGIFGDNMALEEMDIIQCCPSLLSKVIDGNEATIHCRIKVL